MKKLQNIINTYIDTKFTESIGEMNSSEHKEDIENLHKIFNDIKKGVENARRECLLYTAKEMEAFYKKGFSDGADLAIGILSTPDEEVSADD